MGLDHKCKVTRCGHLMGHLLRLMYHDAQWEFWEALERGW